MVKKFLPLIFPLVLLVTVGFYNIMYNTTIMNIQTVPNDSLLIGHDRSLHVGDTVTVTGRVTAPPRVNYSGNDRRFLLRATNSWTAYIQDTTNALWGGIVVRQADSIHNTLFDHLDSGSKVTVTGIVAEFSVGNIANTTTQISLDTLTQVQILPTIKRRPTPIQVNVTDFDSAGSVRFLTGEKYEGMYVQLNNLTVGAQSGSGARHIRSLLDAQGNKIYLRDFSNFYSISASPNWGWTPWVPPTVGAVVTSIRGVIIEGAYADGVFNGNAAFPYVIVPIYPNDLVMGNAPPSIGSVSRSPGVPRPSDSVQVNATVTDSSLSMSVATVNILYRVNRGSYISLNTNNTGSIYYAKMPPQPLGTLVEYFIRAADNLGAVKLSPADTSKSTYFYYVKSSDTLTIKDIQYTPNNGDFSGYNTYTVTTEGIVTADTSDIPAFSFTGPYNFTGTQTEPRRVIIQDPAITGGWSGIWITGNATDPLVKGQRVRVRGIVTEYFGGSGAGVTSYVTSISIAQPTDIIVVSSGNPLPAPEILTPGVFADTKVGGDTTAEKWESVLVRFANQSVITCINAGSASTCTTDLPLPDSSSRRNFGEIWVQYNNEGIPARVELQDGHHHYVNGWDTSKATYYHPTNPPWNLLHKWDGINGLTGIMYQGFGHYKLVPRRDDDWGTVIGVQPISELPTSFWLKQNYPNPFNPSTQIVYNLPATSDVTLKVYNLLGQEVKTLVSGLQTKGRYSIPFDGLNLASGVYAYVFEANSLDGVTFRDVKKMVLIK